MSDAEGLTLLREVVVLGGCGSGDLCERIRAYLLLSEGREQPDHVHCCERRDRAICTKEGCRCICGATTHFGGWAKPLTPIHAGEPVCPHIRSSREGTSYCTLAESGSRPAPSPEAMKAVHKFAWENRGCDERWIAERAVQIAYDFPSSPPTTP